MVAGGGGPVLVHPHKSIGRLDHNLPKLNVHKASVLDLAFSPFMDNILATGAEDGLVKITVLPEDGAFEKVEQANATLEGHLKKISIIRFHPAANNVITSIAFDNTLKVWDIEKSQQMISLDDTHQDLPQSVEWNENGSLLATSCKDKFVRIIDPRAPKTLLKTGGLEGGKSSRVCWFDNHNLLGLVGFSKTNQRQYSVYDPKKFDVPLNVTDLDSSGSILIPYYDVDTSVLFLVGKGDASIRYFEIVSEDPYVHFLSDFRDNESTKGACFLPKAVCDVKSCEIDVCYRVMRDWISPVSFQVPRKSDLFQGDIFPDTFAGVPSMTSSEWAGGENKPIIKRSLKPGSAAPTSSVETKFNTSSSSSSSESSDSSSKSSSDGTAALLAAALAKIKELEEKLSKLEPSKQD
jgi:coronin-1B/1C/6